MKNELNFILTPFSAVLDGSANLLYSFVWGTDLSGTMQGAGGVGGLLAMIVHTGPQAGAYFYFYDGNGNVAGLVSGATGQLVAQYDYGPFGEVVRMTGSSALINPFRFSTKYQDDETGLVYYGYRYYRSSTGRWVSRDPIHELGHEQFRHVKRKRSDLREEQNPYAFAYNSAISSIDPRGEAVWWDCVACAAALVGKFGGTIAGCAYGCQQSSSAGYSYGQCLNDCLTTTMQPCELWNSFKNNPAEWIGAAACISCGVRVMISKPPGCDGCSGFDKCHCFCPSGASPSYTVVKGAPCNPVENVIYEWQSAPDGTPVQVPVGTETCPCSKF